MRLLAASLRHEGYDAEVLEETPASIAEGLKTNTGQCIPLNVIAFEYADWIKKRASSRSAASYD
jgi:predicted nucleotide-binding protein (sugar kinase/HSP70/actin superfamily)